MEWFLREPIFREWDIYHQRLESSRLVTKKVNHAEERVLMVTEP